MHFCLDLGLHMDRYKAHGCNAIQLIRIFLYMWCIFNRDSHPPLGAPTIDAYYTHRVVSWKWQTSENRKEIITMRSLGTRQVVCDEFVVIKVHLYPFWTCVSHAPFEAPVYSVSVTRNVLVCRLLHPRYTFLSGFRVMYGKIQRP